MIGLMPKSTTMRTPMCLRQTEVQGKTGRKANVVLVEVLIWASNNWCMKP